MQCNPRARRKATNKVDGTLTSKELVSLDIQGLSRLGYAPTDYCMVNLGHPNPLLGLPIFRERIDRYTADSGISNGKS